MNRKLMMGNEAIARGFFENGCRVATSYPGTPASEILAHAAKLAAEEKLDAHVQWAVNEKTAFEIAFTAAMCGLRAATAMKQVGLNVASDPLMSAAYMGTEGGFVVVSADDPGPHSSQTEQDSRLFAMFAKVPVLDPMSPADAGAMTALGFEISEAFKTPVMLRPTTRVCHARQDMETGPLLKSDSKPNFEKNPGRWAATPKFRLALHKALEEKLEQIAAFPAAAPVLLNPDAATAGSPKALVASGIAAAYALEALGELGMAGSLPLFRAPMPFPLDPSFIEKILADFDEILILEETEPVMEMQFADRYKVRGRKSGFIPRAGELLPEIVLERVAAFTGTAVQTPAAPQAPGRRPTLCAGCPHRASFFAIKKAAKKGIYTSDIGCYTLGLNLNAVDTVLCMGAAVSQAAGFYHAHRFGEKLPDIVATIGDSTFFHAGVPPLIDAVVQKVPMVLVILDNRTTAMTGSQPTPATGVSATGEALNTVDIEALVKGCGVAFCETGDPYDLEGLTALVKKALAACRESGPAVVISRGPCLLDRRTKEKGFVPRAVEVSDKCDGCRFCVDRFECPALVFNAEEERVFVDTALCAECGVCLKVCPKGAIVEAASKSI